MPMILFLPSPSKFISQGIIQHMSSPHSNHLRGFNVGDITSTAAAAINTASSQATSAVNTASSQATSVATAAKSAASSGASDLQSAVAGVTSDVHILFIYLSHSSIY
jgi:hypothetical protein